MAAAICNASAVRKECTASSRSAVPRIASLGSISIQVCIRMCSTCRALRSSTDVSPPSRTCRIRAEIHSVRVPHHTTIGGSSTRISRTVAEWGSSTRSGTIADASQNFTSPLLARERPSTAPQPLDLPDVEDPKSQRIEVSPHVSKDHSFPTLPNARVRPLDSRWELAEQSDAHAG